MLSRDYPLIQGTVLLVAVFVLASNFLVDVLYAYVDPRDQVLTGTEGAIAVTESVVSETTKSGDVTGAVGYRSRRSLVSSGAANAWTVHGSFPCCRRP